MSHLFEHWNGLNVIEPLLHPVLVGAPNDDLPVWEIYICRYIAASVYIVLLLEHLASLPQEIEFIWKQKTPRSGLPRFFFLLYRYSAVAGLAIINHMMAGISRPLELNVTIAMTAALIFSIGIADGLVMLRVSVLWGRQRLILGILVSFFSTFSAAAIYFVIVATKLVASAEVVPFVSICLYPFGSRQQIIEGIWVPGMVFDGLVLSLAGWNACARPRTQQTAFTVALYRDGVVVFLVSLRAINLFFSVFGTQLYLLGFCISWPISTITLSRFIFRLRCREKGLALPSNSSCDTAVADADSGSCSVPEASSISHQARHNSLG
ncbi:hypothetical protein JB92DRAFT_2863542 [Gautieria morchelliformis]|nr:hypothetical protein JB92DRAFT_2863542 [Gautieria morchelliformis]